MTQLCRRVVHVNIRRSLFDRVSIFRRFFRFIWDRILVCSIGKQPAVRYQKLTRRSSSESSPAPDTMEAGLVELSRTFSSGYDTDSDLVSLKISLLGDCQIGKTSFVVSTFINLFLCLIMWFLFLSFFCNKYAEVNSINFFFFFKGQVCGKWARKKLANGRIESDK